MVTSIIKLAHYNSDCGFPNAESKAKGTRAHGAKSVERGEKIYSKGVTSD